jgi:hypothetical protein
MDFFKNFLLNFAEAHLYEIMSQYQAEQSYNHITYEGQAICLIHFILEPLELLHSLIIFRNINRPFP